MIKMKMHVYLLMLLMLYSCRQNSSAPTNSQTDTLETVPNNRERKIPADSSYSVFRDRIIPKTDSSYARFLDKLISGKNLVFSQQVITAFEPGWDGWAIEDEADSLLHKYMKIGDTMYQMTDFILVNTNDIYLANHHLARQPQFEIDTVILFSFRNNKYAWVNAGDYNPSGGMNERYQLFVDFQYKRVHLFDLDNVPDYQFYFGDIDGDDSLDFVLPTNVYSPCNCNPWPYCDPMLIAFTTYHMNSKGYFEVTKRNGQTSLILAQFYNYPEPRNFKISGSMNCNWPGLSKSEKQ